MTIKFVCDVCDKESETTIDTVRIDEHKKDREPLTFEVCKDCREKLLKSVKRFRTAWWVWVDLPS